MFDRTPLTPERWQQIEQLFADIEERPAERAALLAAADATVRDEVEKMVAASHGPSPLDEPPAQVEPLDGARIPSVLGPYRIEAPLGHGGMGRVFRATDTRLHRSVAIKIPADKLSERFEHEARAIAALNHPHICTLHDVGPAYLVMEMLEGETLAARLLRGKLPLEQTVEYGAQIASALAAEGFDIAITGIGESDAATDAMLEDLAALGGRAIYLKGDDIRSASGDQGEWERDLTLSYVIPEGTLKGLGFSWRNAMLRSGLPASGSGTPTQRDQDENRLIVSYTLPLL